MKCVVVLAPAPGGPGAAAVDVLAALAARHLKARSRRVVVVSPNGCSVAGRFADVVYAEPLVKERLERIAAREGADGILSAFAGDASVLAVPAALGLPDGSTSLARLSADVMTPSPQGSASLRASIELLVDKTGASHLLAVAPASRSPSASSALTRAGHEVARVVAAAAHARGVFGLLSASYRINREGAPSIDEVYFGARSSTLEAARRASFPLGEVVSELLLGAPLDWLDLAGDERPRDLAGEAPLPMTDVLVLGPGASSHVGGAAAWAAEQVLACRARGKHVTVVDDSEASLAGALADRWIHEPPRDAARLATVGTQVFVSACPESRAVADACASRGATVLDVAPGGYGKGKPAAASTRKADVLVLTDGHEALVVGTVEYVESGAVNEEDSAAFFPPQTLPVDEVLAIEEKSRAVVAASGAKGLATVRWRLGEATRMASVSWGPETAEPMVSRALGVRLGELSCELALGETLRSLVDVATFTPRPIVVAREVVLPSGPAARTMEPLDGTPRAIGEALGVGETLAGAYGRALAGVGYRLPHPSARAVLFAPDRESADAAARCARRLHPLGYRLVAIGPVAQRISAMRAPFEALDVPSAEALLAGGAVAFAFITGIGTAPGAAELRRAASAGRVPCFTSELLFEAACATVVEGRVPEPVALAPRRCEAVA
ncbi:MAG: hypothetical protein IPG50_23060 [Myxococcales bacterium]|nr:hypothetical protein [Myxococcales bacterium]